MSSEGNGNHSPSRPLRDLIHPVSGLPLLSRRQPCSAQGILFCDWLIFLNAFIFILFILSVTCHVFLGFLFSIFIFCIIYSVIHNACSDPLAEPWVGPNSGLPPWQHAGAWNREEEESY